MGRSRNRYIYIVVLILIAFTLYPYTHLTYGKSYITPEVVYVGENFTVTIEVVNTGDVVLTDVVPTIKLVPEGLAEVITGPTPPRASMLSPGDRVNFTYILKAISPGDIEVFYEVKYVNSYTLEKLSTGLLKAGDVTIKEVSMWDLLTRRNLQYLIPLLILSTLGLLIFTIYRRGPLFGPKTGLKTGGVSCKDLDSLLKRFVKVIESKHRELMDLHSKLRRLVFGYESMQGLVDMAREYELLASISDESKLPRKFVDTTKKIYSEANEVVSKIEGVLNDLLSELREYNDLLLKKDNIECVNCETLSEISSAIKVYVKDFIEHELDMTLFRLKYFKSSFKFIKEGKGLNEYLSMFSSKNPLALEVEVLRKFKKSFNNELSRLDKHNDECFDRFIKYLNNARDFVFKTLRKFLDYRVIVSRSLANVELILNRLRYRRRRLNRYIDDARLDIATRARDLSEISKYGAEIRKVEETSSKIYSKVSRSYTKINELDKELRSYELIVKKIYKELVGKYWKLRRGLKGIADVREAKELFTKMRNLTNSKLGNYVEIAKEYAELSKGISDTVKDLESEFRGLFNELKGVRRSISKYGFKPKVEDNALDVNIKHVCLGLYAVLRRVPEEIDKLSIGKEDSGATCRHIFKEGFLDHYFRLWGVNDRTTCLKSCLSLLSRYMFDYSVMKPVKWAMASVIADIASLGGLILKPTKIALRLITKIATKVATKAVIHALATSTSLDFLSSVKPPVVNEVMALIFPDLKDYLTKELRDVISNKESLGLTNLSKEDLSKVLSERLHGVIARYASERGIKVIEIYKKGKSKDGYKCGLRGAVLYNPYTRYVVCIAECFCDLRRGLCRRVFSIAYRINEYGYPENIKELSTCDSAEYLLKLRFKSYSR